MATPSLVTSQSIGASETVDDMPDIEQEQRRAATTTAVDPTVKELVTPAAEPIEVEAAEVAETPYKAPLEADAEQPFDLNEFAKYSKKASEITETAPKVEPATVVVPTVTATPVRAADPRDMSDVEEEYKPLLKQMSNEAFAKIKPLIVEQKKLREQLVVKDTEIATAKKSGLPENYYEHEMGYVLSPEFTERSQSVRLADSVLDHWRTQLNAVKGGADTYIPLVNDANGNIVLGQPTKVDRGTDTQLSEMHSWAMQQSMNEKAALNALSVAHREKHGQVKGWVSNFQARAFPVFDKSPELQAAADDTVRSFPAALQSNPLAPMLARAFVALARLSKAQPNGKPAAAAPANGAAAKPAARVAQPSAAQIAGGAASSSAGDADSNLFDQFNKAKQGLL